MDNGYTREVHNEIMKNIFLRSPQYLLGSCLFCLVIIMAVLEIGGTKKLTLMAVGIMFLYFLILRRSRNKIRKLLRTVFEDEFADYIIKHRYKIFYEDFWELKKMIQKMEYGNPDENFYLRFRYYLTTELPDEIKERNNEKEQRYKEFLEKYGDYNEK
jgi:hypothetical protein